MELIKSERDAVNLLTTPLHLGLGSRARAMQGFAWTPEALEAYTAATAADGAEGRMLIVIDDEGPGDHWERHPHGDEVVVCLAGRVTVVYESGDTLGEVLLRPGEATVNQAGVWHAVDMDGQARILTITPGVGSEHRHRG